MPIFKRRWFMWDFARQHRFDREEFSLVAGKLKDLGYDGIGLYLEGAFEFKLGGILREGIMTREDAVWVKEKCAELGLFVFPMTNVVGHMEHFLRQERFKYLKMDKKNTGSVDNIDSKDIDFNSPEAEEFALKLLYDLIEAFDTKYIHIGGDEVKLTDENKPIYAKFLSGICDKLIADGITVGIWNDMMWAHKELIEPFNREVEIFDWYYFGHRKGSAAFFAEKGFKNVITCPCENSWIGFIGHQCAAPWVRKDRIEVEPDEIEAFFGDAVSEADNNNLQGLVTHWESTQGRNLWGQWSALARAVLYMNGKFDQKPCDDTALELALFGRITPYTEITHIIQNEIQDVMVKEKYSLAQMELPRQSLFLKFKFKELVAWATELDFKYAEKFNTALDKADALFSAWKPQTEFEEKCYISMKAILSMARAGISLLSTFADCKNFYTAAAIAQFDNPENAKAKLLEYAKMISDSAEFMKVYMADLKALVNATAHTETDIEKLEIMIGCTVKLADYLVSYANSEMFNKIPLPAIIHVAEWILFETSIEK